MTSMLWKRFAKLAIALVLAVVSFGFGGRNLAIEALHTESCPDTPEYQNLTLSGPSSQRADCYMVVGTVINESDRTVLNADVFGRIYDADGNDVMPERTRVGSIDEVPPGKSEFSIRITASQSNRPPLVLEQFKASGFGGAVRR
ncbi:MAG: FxLYD domain-containing protein [Cyanobacteria bacterium J06639_1]